MEAPLGDSAESDTPSSSRFLVPATAALSGVTCTVNRRVREPLCAYQLIPSCTRSISPTYEPGLAGARRVSSTGHSSPGGTTCSNGDPAIVLGQHQFPARVEPVIADGERTDAGLFPRLVARVAYLHRERELRRCGDCRRRGSDQFDRRAVSGVRHRLDLGFDQRIFVRWQLEHEQAAGLEQSKELAQVVAPRDRERRAGAQYSSR